MLRSIDVTLLYTPDGCDVIEVTFYLTVCGFLGVTMEAEFLLKTLFVDVFAVGLLLVSVVIICLLDNF